MADGSEPIEPGEIIYRRIPAAWAGDPFPSPLAFTPRKEDLDGLSVYRAKYTTTIAEIAHNDRGASYCVAVLKAGDLTNAGIDITPSPKPGKPGHSHLPAINYTDRKEPRVIDLINLLTTKLSTTHGPFPGGPPNNPDEHQTPRA